MRKKLRDFYTERELAIIYNHDYRHSLWKAHVERVEKTVLILDEFAQDTDSHVVADLSEGDGVILRDSRHPWSAKITGDLRSLGPIEQSIEKLHYVDMFLLSETLEHVEDPDLLLHRIRAKSSHLLLTTPCGEVTDENPEHYWGWDQAGLDVMLDAAGWNVRQSILFTPPSDNFYTFQIWKCS